jgi:hypothetical protein
MVVFLYSSLISDILTSTFEKGDRAMKKLTFAAVAVVVTVLVFAITPVQAGNVPATEFLAKYYGITIVLPEGADQLGFPWNMTCPSDRDAFPKEGGKFRADWFCNQKTGKGFSVAAYWRLMEQKFFEEAMLKEYTGGREYTKECDTKILHSAVDSEGVLTSCTVLMSRRYGEPSEMVRHMAFYHFRVELATIPHLSADFPLKNLNGSLKKKLGFSLVVGSEDTSEPVEGQLRELVAALQPATVLHASQ